MVKKFTIKSWQAFIGGIVLVEWNAIMKSLWMSNFPTAEVNIFLTWILGFYLVKRVTQKHKNFNGASSNHETK